MEEEYAELSDIIEKLEIMKIQQKVATILHHFINYSIK